MREILFRGKDLQERNGWLYGYFYKSDINKRERESGKATLIFTPNCDTFIYVPEYHNSWMVKPETLGEYVGLEERKVIATVIAMNNCSRNTLCIDCDNTECAFQGKKESDCPKWHCDRPDYAKLDCDHCGFIDKFIDDIRKMYSSETLKGEQKNETTT